MGKFSDTRYVNTIDSLVNATKSKLENPYYQFADKKPTKVTYYSQNIEKSTLDESSGLFGSHVGTESPFVFNKINDFILYGIERMTTEYDAGDLGLQANPIDGEAVVLPNTIIPRPGDFFSIPYVKEPLLFKVTSSSPDTLDNGANMYRIEYSLNRTNAIETIEKQIHTTYNFFINNVGTDMKAIMRSTDVDMINELKVLTSDLITIFYNIFFKTKLQTFVYNHDGWNMYDPFLIEFLIRNKVLSFGDKYIHVDHAAYINNTFSMDYNETFFRYLERKDKDLRCPSFATADLITDINSLFSTRIEDYYAIKYVDRSPYKTRLQVFDPEVLERIKENKSYDEKDNKEFYNLWIGYFNESDQYITGRLMDLIRKMDYEDNLTLFYALPINIFIIEKYIENLMS